MITCPPVLLRNSTTQPNRYLDSLQKTRKAEAASSELINSLDIDIKSRYDILTKMLKAATDVVFKSDPALKKMFMLSTLEQQVRLTKKTTLVGSVRAAGSNKRIIKAVISIQNFPLLTTTSGKEAKFKIELEKGTYQVKVKAPGYQTFATTKTVEEGIRNTLTVYLTPLLQQKIDEIKPEPVSAKRRKGSANGVKV
ncbi:MAG: carboxypeptidase regulatory-like domain-containing protein [Saprospiraceae bacterium]|nr:carboxypeptidase regulatory-like domain-containing protein [Saprospiraceae bacterium]